MGIIVDRQESGEIQEEKAMPVTPANAKQGTVMSPFAGIMGAGDDLMSIATLFGIEKKDIGKMALKAIFSGKGLGVFNEYTEKKSKYEKFVRATNDLTTRIFIFVIVFYLLHMCFSLI